MAQRCQDISLRCSVLLLFTGVLAAATASPWQGAAWQGVWALGRALRGFLSHKSKRRVDGLHHACLRDSCSAVAFTSAHLPHINTTVLVCYRRKTALSLSIWSRLQAVLS